MLSLCVMACLYAFLVWLPSTQAWLAKALVCK